MSYLKPQPFADQNVVLGAPEEWSDEVHGECEVLPIKRENGVCTSLWGLTFWQKIRLLLGWRLWLHVASGNTQPPVMLTISKELGR